MRSSEEETAMPDPTAARKALHELLDLLREVDERYLSPEWLMQSPQDVAEGMYAVMHQLQGGLQGWFESDAEHPIFRRIVAPWRKFTGDNADAIYYDAAVRGDRSYRVRGRRDGAVYVSITVEAGSQDGRMGGRTDGVINDTQLDVGPDGRFELFVGGPKRPRNWIALPPDASRLTTRHYYEDATCAAADPKKHPALEIEMLEKAAAPPPAPNDESVAAGLRRVANFVRARTLEMPPPGKRQQPAFVSTTPNQFPPPARPDGLGLAALDAHYSMAPFVLGPEQALVITGRWPTCRCANVDLWSRHQQTFDYVNRQVTLNRKQTQLLPDGSFRMVIAHRDPGVPNWLDTEGRPFGMVFWRFFLAEGPVETPQARVVPFVELRH
jgi:hypothetical protein